MNSSQAQALRSKWHKTQLLLQHGSIKPFVPETRKYSKITVKSMLEKYGMVYVKPDRGTFGKGVMKIEQEAGQRFAYQYEEKRLEFKQLDALITSLSKHMGKKSYLIQKGIHLLRHQNRYFDIRVMVQRNAKGTWESTGIIGRLGHPRKIVTNYHSGGKPMALEQLLKSHLSQSKQAELVKKLNELGITIATQLQKTYPNFRQIGVDIGLDHRFIPWIIEVNTKPDPYIFNQLTDKSMYRKVISYWRLANEKKKVTVPSKDKKNNDKNKDKHANKVDHTNKETKSIKETKSKKG
ncbi:YheC/YheD family protein [Paenibacillus polymyxa]|uniref:Endospore coat-associated protein yheC n=1 Tax=Paenibacillus polymyxa TaxID=1406 RepID=A0A378XXM2_PAEPO|nr:YheC/YheD family protein [Paenibacillus polymyxa]MBE3649256.1 YheC/YheD family protein [Paenibacillus polymyxa]MBE7899964.1 YheC/YheD family protein [Paenibacillus polymyxa]MBG9764635.1 endospore coat-associated protein [Paenibacillus polymyxa]MCC3259633.1 YheC/YheD family protein [Paenibacillus polymyxa]MEE4580048.1 YheC/YheD family protein [Paenibacillus polymyxa]